MTRELPFIEKVWRVFRESRHSDLNSMCLEYQRTAKTYLDKWDEFSQRIIKSYTVLPSVMAYMMIKRKKMRDKYWKLFAEAWIDEHGEPVAGWDYESFLYSFFASYRRSKVIWNLDRDFEDAIGEIPFPDDTPVSALAYLPCESIVFPFDDSDICFLCWYDSDIGDDGKPELILRFGFLSPDENYKGDSWGDTFYAPNGAIILPLPKINLSKKQSLKDAFSEMQWCDDMVSTNKSERESYTDKRKNFAKIINTLLYAAGCDDIVKLVGHEYSQSVKKAMRKQSGDPKEIKKDLSDPQEFDIGVKFGVAIKQYRAAVERESHDGIPTGRSVRPHMRRAHSHLYWTGINRDVPRVLFLAPIAVNMSELKEEQSYSLIRKVV